MKNKNEAKAKLFSCSPEMMHMNTFHHEDLLCSVDELEYL